MGWFVALLLIALVARAVVLLPDVLSGPAPVLGDRTVRWTVRHGAPRLDQRLPEATALRAPIAATAAVAGSVLVGIFALGAGVVPIAGALVLAGPLVTAWAARTLVWRRWWSSELTADADGVELSGPGRDLLRLPWSEVRGVRAEDGYLVIEAHDPWFVPVAAASAEHVAPVVRALEALRPPSPPAALTLSAPVPVWSITALLGFLPTITREPPEPEVEVDGITWEVGHTAPPSGWRLPRTAPLLIELGAWVAAGLVAAAASSAWFLAVAAPIAVAVALGCVRTWRPYWSTRVRAAQHGLVLDAPGRDALTVPWGELVAIGRVHRAVAIWTRTGAPIRLPVRVGEEALADRVVALLEAARRSAGPALPELPPELPEALRALTRRAVRRPAPWERT